MKKNHLCIAAALITLGAGAQTDSLKRFRISGFQLDLAFMGSNSDAVSREKFKAFVHENELLNRDLSGYRTGLGEPAQNINGYTSAKVYATVFFGHHKSKKAEVFAGLRYGSTSLASAYYSKNNVDTTGIYVNQANGTKLIKADEYYSGYNYTIDASNILLPIGIRVSTNQKRRFWFSAGIELAPGILFNHALQASHVVTKSELILNENSALEQHNTYTRGRMSPVLVESSHKRLSGVGFNGYATAPLSASLRLSKRVKFLEHLNLTGTLAPGAYVNRSRYSASTGLVLNTALGIRYNL